MKSINRIFSILIILTMTLSGFTPLNVNAQAENGDGLKRQRNAESGKVSFLGPESGSVVPAERALGFSAQPQDPAMALAERFAPEFGIANPEKNLTEIKTNTLDDGRIHARYQQTYKGIPVMAGELIVNTNKRGDLYSMSGEASPNLSLSVQPGISDAQAIQTTLELMAKWYEEDQASFIVSKPELWIFDESLLQPSTRPAELVWRMEVTSKNLGLPLRELVLVDAQRGGISLHFNQVDTAWTANPSAEEPTPTETPTEQPTQQPTEEPTATEAPTEEPVATEIPTLEPATPTSSTADAAPEVATTWYVATTGDDANDCATTTTPCATINAAIGKAAAGDQINIATGTYTSSGTEVVLINKSITLFGGWSADFAVRDGISTIDGEKARRGIVTNYGIITNLNHFAIVNGIANGGAGMYISNGGTVTLNNTSISNNSSPYNPGGGIYNSGNLTLNNTTISGNSAGSSSLGGGIYNSGSLTLNNTTISGNSAYQGGGIAKTGSGNMYLWNSILAGNAASSQGPDCYGAFSSGGYNIIGNTASCTITANTGDKFNINPGLSEFLSAKGYYPLTSSSPAIDSGNPLNCIPTDQRGLARIGVCDIGAYEYTTPGVATSLTIAGGDNQRTTPNLSFPKLLKVAALDDNGTPVPGVEVTFTAPATGPSSTFANTGTNTTSIITDENGIASTSIVTANNELGAYTITASVIGFTSISFNVENAALYVSSSGNDTNTCDTPASPCQTIGAAIAKAFSGDTVFVAAETFITETEDLLIDKRISLSGGWNASFTIQNGKTILYGQKINNEFNSITTIINFIISGNHGAGGVSNSGQLTLNNSIIKGNSASGNYIGGGVSNSGQLTINNSTINGNYASNGGGIYNFYGTVTLNNATINGNYVSNSGGGIYNYYGTIILNNTTVSNNSASSEGGGVYAFTTVAANGVFFRNSIIAENTSRYIGANCTGDSLSGSNSKFTSWGNNIIASTSGCNVTATTGDKFNVSPKLGIYLPVQGYQPLLLGSPAINAGNPATCTPTDQRGLARVGTCDIGAYEYTSPGAAANIFIVQGNNQRATPNLAFVTPLKVAVLDTQGSPVPGVEVIFTAPATGASGVFTDTSTNTTSAITDAGGVSTASTFTANNELGAYIVSASSSGLTSVDFNLENGLWFVASSGNDANSCSAPTAPCQTINAAIGKATAGDTILIAAGIFTSTTNEVVLLNKSVVMSGGWNTDFTTQNGLAILDGQNVRRGLQVNAGITAKLDHFSIVNGKADHGGGIYNSGTLTLNNITISGNSANGAGGGILNKNTLTVNATSISGNSAYSGGGISNERVMVLTNTTINGNSAGQGGGGIHQSKKPSYPASLNLKNVTISGNSSTGYGGGISNTDGTIIINNSTITANISSGGGGIYIFTSQGVIISNSILASNKTSSAEPDCRATIKSAGYNIIGNNQGCVFTPAIGDQIGNGANPIKPRLSALQNNGGPTLTHALIAGSPAMNAGSPATPGSSDSACESTDQRGVARPAGLHCDIGAYEGSVPWTGANPKVNTYTANNSTNLPGSLLCNQSEPTCTNGANPHADAAHQHAIGTYHLYETEHLRDSINNGGMIIKSIVHYRTDYDNAFWSGQQIVYGDKYGFPLADDVVAHELTHGVTEHESNLFYYYQSGAINESFSDLWGEYYDQSNGLGNDAASVKWLIGEDVTGVGAIRSMSNPPKFNDPDKMTSKLYYKGDGDNGGVHTNSGINNKAVYLMVAGGSFNGKNVTALGWTKTAAIYYEVNTYLLTSGADYSDLYYAIQQACSSLVGFKGITTSNCAQVKNAIDAVQMNAQPISKFNSHALVCGNAQPIHAAFMDDLENGASQWTLSGGRWQYNSPYGSYAHSGVNFLYADDYPAKVTDTSAKLQAITVPPNAYLSFWHAFGFETASSQNPSYYDGGVIEYSINNGSSWQDAGALMDYNGYKASIYESGTNPLKGRKAFVSASHGYISTRLNLASLAGKNVIFRWRMGLDGTGYNWGWWVDDVQVYTCPDAASLSSTSVAAQDGWVLESSETSGLGGTTNPGGTTLLVGDNNTNKQYRGFLSFNTAALPDSAVIVGATLKLIKQTITGTDPFKTHGELLVDIRKPYFGAGVGLAASDFQASASLVKAGSFLQLPFNNQYAATLKGNSLSFINKTGTTQFRLGFSLDDNNDGGNNYIAFYSGNHSSATYRPVLIINYYLP